MLKKLLQTQQNLKAGGIYSCTGIYFFKLALRFNRYFPFIPNENGDLMQYCECTNDFVNAIIDDYFNSFEIRKYYINKYEQPYYAVRISKLVEDDTGKVKRKYTYLAYFAKPEMAYTYLAEYNSGAVVPEHMKYSDSPTFAEMYEKWKKYRKSLKNQISDSHGEIMRLLFIISVNCMTANLFPSGQMICSNA